MGAHDIRVFPSMAFGSLGPLVMENAPCFFLAPLGLSGRDFRKFSYTFRNSDD
jgi:hypothetical protein